MAEVGVFLTSSQEKHYPSIFEVVAADSLHSTFYPALKKIAKVNITFIYFVIKLHKFIIYFIYSIWEQLIL